MLAIASAEHFLLYGKTGAGKTWFCNRNDGSYCGREGNDGFSTTGNPYKGNILIDMRGTFGNREGETSIQTVNETLRIANTTSLYGMLWMVECQTSNPNGQEIKYMKFIIDTLGSQLPVIALFNPGSAENKCKVRPFARHWPRWPG
jgi:hypothetical protein